VRILFAPACSCLLLFAPVCTCLLLFAPVCSGGVYFHRTCQAPPHFIAHFCVQYALCTVGLTSLHYTVVYCTVVLYYVLYCKVLNCICAVRLCVLCLGCHSFCLHLPFVLHFRGVEYARGITSATLTVFPHDTSGKSPTMHKLQAPSSQQPAAPGAKAPKTPLHDLCSQVIQLITT